MLPPSSLMFIPPRRPALVPRSQETFASKNCCPDPPPPHRPRHTDEGHDRRREHQRPPAPLHVRSAISHRPLAFADAHRPARTHNAIALTGLALLRATWNRRISANRPAVPNPPEGGRSCPAPGQDAQAVERLPRYSQAKPWPVLGLRRGARAPAHALWCSQGRTPRRGRGAKRSGALPIELVRCATEAGERVLARGPAARFFPAAIYVQLSFRWSQPTQSEPTGMEQEATKPERPRSTDRDLGWHAQPHSGREWSGTECMGSQQAAPSGTVLTAAVADQVSPSESASGCVSSSRMRHPRSSTTRSSEAPPFAPAMSRIEAIAKPTPARSRTGIFAHWCCSASPFDPQESKRINVLQRRSASNLRA